MVKAALPSFERSMEQNAWTSNYIYGQASEDKGGLLFFFETLFVHFMPLSWGYEVRIKFLVNVGGLV